VEKIIYSTLGDPITPEYVKDVNDLEKKQREVPKEAKRVKKMGKKLDGDIAQAQDALKHARNMEEKYITLIQQVMDGCDP
jgi:phage regulator Rha-like protein